MQVTFWGVRGSIPTPLTPDEVEEKAVKLAQAVVEAGITHPREIAAFLEKTYPKVLRGTAGGNTACVGVQWGNTVVALDAGTGIRMLGKHLMLGSLGRGGGEVHLLMSHTHWDHIMGFPYFAPLFKNNTIHIYGGHADIEQRFRDQQDSRFYPVPLDIFPAKIIFHHIEEGQTIPLPEGGSFRAMKLHHPGDCYGYRIEQNGKILIYATDSEYKESDNGHYDRAIAFFRDADLLIFDSQYTVEESLVKEDWGHSTAVMGVKLAAAACVKRLALFHHEPSYADDFILDMLRQALTEKQIGCPDAQLEVLLTYEGLRVDL